MWCKSKSQVFTDDGGNDPNPASWNYIEAMEYFYFIFCIAEKQIYLLIYYYIAECLQNDVLKSTRNSALPIYEIWAEREVVIRYWETFSIDKILHNI